MSDNNRQGCPLLLGERQQLHCKAKYRIAIECVIGRYPEEGQNREQSRCSFTELFALFDQCTRFSMAALASGEAGPFRCPRGLISAT